ncbi:MAG: hypothetical protein CL902_01210 [Dehalococcoidia bacterium]|nr:hypothetical protein [Dehalococcoidia bacterium]
MLEVATSESRGKNSSNSVRTIWNPAGSASTNTSYAARVAGGGGGGETSYSNLTFGSSKSNMSTSYWKDSSASAPGGQLSSIVEKIQLTIIISSVIAEAKAAPEHMSLRLCRSGPEWELISTCLINSASVGSNT